MRTLRRWSLQLVGISALLAAVLLYQQRGWHTPTEIGVVPTTVETRDSLTATTAPSPLPRPATVRPPLSRLVGQVPVALSIPAIHVDQAPVVRVTVSAGSLDVPDNPKTLGWWAGGAHPGSLIGTAVLVGHVDSARSGPGALFHLGVVPLGSEVSITTATGGRLTYRVVGRRVYPKQVLPSQVFARGGPARLVLITCGGPFNRATHHYVDNVVVYAVPVVL